MQTQEIVFEAQLKLATETNKPIVIHCRETEKMVLKIMKENLKKTHRIHLHCFTGDWDILSQYFQHFENLCVGFTPLITYDYNLSFIKENIIKTPLDRLLVETDSPYFVPRSSEVSIKKKNAKSITFI
jgi:TatD DNase family protein